MYTFRLQTIYMPFFSASHNGIVFHSRQICVSGWRNMSKWANQTHTELRFRWLRACVCVWWNTECISSACVNLIKCVMGRAYCQRTYVHVLRMLAWMCHSQITVTTTSNFRYTSHQQHTLPDGAMLLLMVVLLPPPSPLNTNHISL